MALTASQITIKVTPEVLLAKADEVSGEIGRMSNAFDTLTAVMARTKHYWIGEAGDLHRSLYEEQREAASNMLQRWRELPADLQLIAQTYTTAENEAKTLTGMLTSDVIQ